MSARPWPVFLAVIVALLALIALPSPGLATSTTKRLGVSPHDQPGACASCHEASAGVTPGKVKPIEANCRSCHPDADMHPVGMRPKDIEVGEGFPLEDGIVTCATCHAEPSCDAKRPDVAPYLRGGIPDRKMDFCYRCHEPAVLTRSNPHLPPSATGTPDENCGACHSGRPDDGAPPLASRLRLALDEACATCHPGPVHAGAAEHTAAVQKEALGVEGTRLLPLLDGGKIACWTCHDVHVTTASTDAVPHAARRRLADRLVASPPGATAGAAATAATPATSATAAHNPMLAMPADDGSLCRACHGKGP